MRAILIDPGKTTSAVVTAAVGDVGGEPPWGVTPIACRDIDNRVARLWLREHAVGFDLLVIEVMPTVYQGAGARDQLAAERWAGRFVEAFEAALEFAGARPRTIEAARASARAATIGRARGTDAELRRALIDMYGGDEIAFGAKCKACGGKGWRGVGRPACGDCGGSGWRVPEGPLAGFQGSHVFAALALGIHAFEPGGPGR